MVTKVQEDVFFLLGSYPDFIFFIAQKATCFHPRSRTTGYSTGILIKLAYIESYKGQQWLLPPSLEEMIPDDHICFLVESIVESMDFTSFDIRNSGAGHPAYHPRILLKILIMGILDRVRSSRRLAKNARENIVYMYLSEKITPDFRTISDFRKDNGDIVKEAFKHTVTFAREEGLLDLTHLST